MKFRLSLPGLDSYRGRYLYLTSLTLLLISLFAYINWKDIHGASQLTRQNIIFRNSNVERLNDVINQFQVIKFQVYQFALTPDPENKALLTLSMGQLLELTGEMEITVFDDIDSEILNDFIFRIPEQLHLGVVDFIGLRSNNQRWIPATQIMNEQLLPINQQVVLTINSIIDDEELEETELFPLKQVFQNLKTSWLNIIAQFRLLTADRLGIFNSTNQAIYNRLHNLAILKQHIKDNLNSLEHNREFQSHDYLYEVMFPQLKENIFNWIDIHENVVEMLQQPDWRKDINALKKLDKQLEKFSQIIVILRDELSVQSDQDIQSLNEINDSLSMFFMVFIFLGFLFAILAYLFFDRNILRPIARTTNALLLQSQGMSDELDISSRASETRDLIDAFNHMRQQINQRETRLDFIAHHDTLTQLPNRLMFNERLKHAIKLTERSEKLVSLMLLDLDRFKLVNDTHGHLFGDKLLQETATRLKNCMRTEDTIARLGGDEFSIIVENITSTAEVESFANKIIALFKKPFLIDGQEIQASTSIGIALAPLNSSDPTTLIRYADIAMYKSKNMGRNQFTWFHNELEFRDDTIIDLEDQLEKAIQSQQFEIHYQPIVDTDHTDFIEFEALLRWRHPDRGLIYPEQFNPILNNPAMVFELTSWFIRKSHELQKKIMEIYNITPLVSVNLPSAMFQHKQYRTRIETILLNEISFSDSFMLEITEATLMADMKNISISLNMLHDKGFKITLDNFGTGQSSLSQLRTFPIDAIKIDSEFVHKIHSDSHDERLVNAIISLGNELGLCVMASGVDNQHQLSFLKSRGCHKFQGLIFCKPRPAEEYLTYLHRHINSN